MEFIITVIGLLILLFVVEKITNKILSVEQRKISETSGKSIDRWGQTILFIVFLIMLWFAIDSSDFLLLFYVMIYLALYFGFQAIIEFIYIKESRQYISTIVVLILILGVMYNLDHDPFW
ncbi:DUF4181 domain-containing protein [Gracilibacillus suaedae]|uniref:DUF4181 domain-containing protein n=1 Tax=Gracilibacillus suaedae TaxID=2820273 RepID=UPI001ABE0EF8|nr:DUF4181 domain-containing protein [Gracilibacillus suaedae]